MRFVNWKPRLERAGVASRLFACVLALTFSAGVGCSGDGSSTGNSVPNGTPACNDGPGTCTYPGTADNCRNGAVCQRPCATCDYGCYVNCSTNDDCARNCSSDGTPETCGTLLGPGTFQACGEPDGVGTTSSGGSGGGGSSGAGSTSQSVPTACCNAPGLSCDCTATSYECKNATYTIVAACYPGGGSTPGTGWCCLNPPANGSPGFCRCGSPNLPACFGIDNGQQVSSCTTALVTPP